MADTTGSSKLAGKLADKPAPTKIPQPHGGALLSGGVPGHEGAGGRPKKELVEWAKEIVSDPEIQRVYTSRAKAGDLKVFSFAAERAEGKAREHKEVSGVLEVRHIYDDGAGKPEHG